MFQGTGTFEDQKPLGLFTDALPFGRNDKRHRYVDIDRTETGYDIAICYVCGKMRRHGLSLFTATTRRAFMPVIMDSIFKQSPLLSAGIRSSAP